MSHERSRAVGRSVAPWVDMTWSLGVEERVMLVM